jgi:ribonuclease Z
VQSQPFGFTLTCRRPVAHIADAFIQSGEIAQRISEDKKRLAGGPAELARAASGQAAAPPRSVMNARRLRYQRSC